MLRHKLILIFTLYTLSSALPCYALSLDNLKAQFLSGDYKAAIAEGEKMMSRSRHDEPGTEELYYLLGLSYLEDGNYLRASDIFEIILTEFRSGNFREEAKLGLGDAYFLRGDLDKAEGYYKEIINSNPRAKNRGAILYRLAQSGFKKGDTQQAREYLDKLKTEFPMNLELSQNKDLALLVKSSGDIYYNVQVGSFSEADNAGKLAARLNTEGYDAYIEEAGSRMYRVKVGRFKARQEAVALEARLSAEGYPTKICP